jgi:prolipoprotein diacylglyceryltransferase
VYPRVDEALRINTNLLSMLFEGLLLFAVNSILFRKMIKKQFFQIGKITSVFLIGYSLFRFFFEYLRNDAQAEFVGLFTKSQWFFLMVFVGGWIVLFLLFILRRWNSSKEMKKIMSL